MLIAGITWLGSWATGTPTAPSGWTLIRRDGDNVLGQFLYYRVAGSSEPSGYTWTGPTNTVAGGMLAYSGVDTSNPINTSSGTVNEIAGSAVAPSVTTTRPNVALIGFFGLVAASPQTPPASMTAVWNGATALGGSNTDVSTLAAQQSWPTPGATGNRTATGIGSKTVGQLVALQPPSPPFATVTWTPSTSPDTTGQDYRRTVNATLQRQASLGAATTSEYDGPLVSGVSYTVTLRALLHNWASAGASVNFTGQVCP